MVNLLDLFSDPRALQRLRSACQRAKHDLSVASMARIDIESLCDGIDFSATLSRARLEELYQDAFLKIFDLVEKVLTDSKTKKEEVYDFVLAGGSTRIPRIPELLTVFFDGKKAQRRINPDEAGVYGASVHAAILTGSKDEIFQAHILLPICPFPIGYACLYKYDITKNLKNICEQDRNVWWCHDYPDKAEHHLRDENIRQLLHVSITIHSRIPSCS